MKFNNLVLPIKFRLIGDGEGTPDLQTIRLFIDKNKEDPKVTQFLNDIRPINEDVVSKFLNEDDNGKKLFNRLTDKKVTEGVNSFKTKYETETLPKKIQEEIEKLNIKETPEQKLLREQGKEIEKLKFEGEKTKLKNTALELMTELKLPFAQVVDSFIGEDENSTIIKIQKFKYVFDAEIKKVTEEVKKQLSGRSPETPEVTLTSLEKQLDDAKSKGNLLEVIRLKRKISETKK